jgi:hypothetical protein
MAERSPMFARGLGDSFAFNLTIRDRYREDNSEVSNSVIDESFPSIGREMEKRIWKMADSNDEFAQGFGSSLAGNLPFLSEEFEKQLLEKISKLNLATLRGSVGLVVGFNLKDYGAEVREKINRKIGNEYYVIENGIGSAISSMFTYLDTSLQLQYLEIAKSTEDFSRNLGMNLADKLETLSEVVQRKIWVTAETIWTSFC